MQKIQIQLSAKNLFFSKATRWMTRGDFGHTDIVLPNGMLLGAHILSGIKQISYNPKNYSKTRRFEFYISDEDYEIMLQKQGIGYDVKAILGFIFKSKLLESPHKLICSEFVWEYAIKKSEQKKQGVSLSFHGSKISPRDVNLICDVLSKFKNSGFEEILEY
jgi:hypothetical protein